VAGDSGGSPLIPPQSAVRVPAYFDYLIEGFRRGQVGRYVHLGYWSEPANVVPGEYADGEFARAQKRLDELMLGMAGLADGHHVLDAGCGFGGTIESINARHSGMRLTGLNVDERQLALCSQLRPAHGNTLAWKEADACTLPFADGAFDRVLCFEAMFHFRSRRAFFSEAARVLKPGGALIGSDMVISPGARTLDVPGFEIEGTLQQGYGPWPDFWGAEADHPKFAKASGLRQSDMKDVTAGVLPSHLFTAPPDADIHVPSRNPALRAALMLRWLHQQGHLRYLCFRFDK
jgi:MPBQ/MSBQ methyltransferase